MAVDIYKGWYSEFEGRYTGIATPTVKGGRLTIPGCLSVTERR
jgi:hypothetical protein